MTKTSQNTEPRDPSGLGRPFAVAATTTAVVTALSYLLPEAHAATGVGLAFLAATYLVALRGDQPDDARRHGLSLGGLMDRTPLDPRRLVRDSLRAVAWGVGLAVVVLPPFWVGYALWWQPAAPFDPAPSPRLLDDALGQLLVIALPEEAFYRGYLQRAFDDAQPPRTSVLRARLGPGVVWASALFAAGHVLTEVHPSRLAVFFPALLFGWLRARTGGIGASVVFHATCNLFASYLAQGYGFAP